MTDLIVPAPLLHPGRLLRGIDEQIQYLEREREKMREDGFSGYDCRQAVEALKKIQTEIVIGKYDS